MAPGELEKIHFEETMVPPIQKIFPIHGGTAKFMVFKSGKCRIMGLTNDIIPDKLPFKIRDCKIQGVTLVFSLGRSLNLIKLCHNLAKKSYIFEPELFPAVRLLNFLPMCVNVFSSGKVMILGAKQLTNHNLISEIVKTINTADTRS